MEIVELEGIKAMNANIYRREFSACEITLLRFFFFASQFAVDKGIYWRDLQSLYCVFISFDLMLCMWNEFRNSFRGLQAAEIRNLSLPSSRSLLSNLCRMCLRFSFIHRKFFYFHLQGKKRLFSKKIIYKIYLVLVRMTTNRKRRTNIWRSLFVIEVF